MLVYEVDVWSKGEVTPVVSFLSWVCVEDGITSLIGF
jgi:hypothetical protein